MDIGLFIVIGFFVFIIYIFGDKLGIWRWLKDKM